VIRPAPFVAAIAAAVVVLASCGGGNGKPASGEPAEATGRWGQVHTGLCTAAAAAAEGDRPAAERAYDDVHAPLHELAAAVERKDRAAAARLLEAKQRVESTGGADDLEDLAVTVAEGIRLTGGTAPRRCA
jgi:hypothetical protein